MGTCPKKQALPKPGKYTFSPLRASQGKLDGEVKEKLRIPTTVKKKGGNSKAIQGNKELGKTVKGRQNATEKA